MPDFRRGMKAMNTALDSQQKSSGPLPAFCPSIQWNDDREEKFIAFLNTADNIPTVELHSFIPTGTAVSKAGKTYTKYEQFISRTDQAIGESSDDLTDRLGRKAQLRTIGVAVELEPTYTTGAGGRKRPNGFQVKTSTYSRKTEDGGVEEVEAPIMGVVVQSPNNFFGWVGSFNESTAPIEEVPLQVIRRGKDANTAYDFTPFLDQPIDYSNLFDNISGISYLREELADIEVADLDPTSDDAREVAISIGDKMLDKRLNELADGDRYERLVSPIEHIEDRFGNNAAPAKGKVTTGSGAARPSQRTAVGNGAAPKSAAKFEDLRRMHEPA